MTFRDPGAFSCVGRVGAGSGSGAATRGVSAVPRRTTPRFDPAVASVHGCV
jgi:hypothetical protein